MSQVKDLVNFEEIKDVIDIDSDLNDRSSREQIVDNYIISDGIKPHLTILAENFSKPKHKSVQIIGNYGSGKSHLQGWIVSILENPDLINKVSDKQIREKYSENIDREFAVVHFELQPGNPSLADFFFDRVKKQLKEKYDIEIPDFDLETAPDYKDYVSKIVEKVKEDNDKRALVVVIDEISDFLKQKEKQKSERDNQFLRVLGQVSKKTDFILIGSMQENVFTNPKYIDDAESFGRVSGRFEQVTISQEDIKTVITKRILSKDDSQRNQTENLLENYRKDFDNINSNIDEFVSLYPVHPQIIKIFNELEYFEKRGAIQFITRKVKEVLDEENPEFVTLDQIYDEISNTHTIKNLDDVRPIVETVNTLESKINLLNEDIREEAERIVKALAVLKLYGKTNKNGAVPKEIANYLLIESDTIGPEDKVTQILSKIRKRTSGQFVSKTEDNYFYLDKENSVDYEEVVNRRSENLPDGLENEKLLSILEDIGIIDASSSNLSYERVFPDTCTWKSKKSFREGKIIFDDGSDEVELDKNVDYNLVIVSPYESNQTLEGNGFTAVLNLEYNEDLDDSLKKLAASSLLINEDYNKQVMKAKRQEFKKELKDQLLQELVDSEIELEDQEKKIKSVLTNEPETLDECFHYIKKNLFDQIFNEKYPKYPKQQKQLSKENIESEVETTMKDLVRPSANLRSNSKALLSSLDLINVDDNIDTSDSQYCEIIKNMLKQNEGKSIKIDKIAEELGDEPYGLQEELTQLLLIVTTYNGETILKEIGGGKHITSSKLEDEFSNGLSKFKELKFVTLETNFPVDKAINIVGIFDIPPGLIRRSSERTKAVQRFRGEVLDIEKRIEDVQDKFERIQDLPYDLDIDGLTEKVEELEELPLKDLKDVETVNDFKNSDISSEQINTIEEKIELLDGIEAFTEEFNNHLGSNIEYLNSSNELIEEREEIFPEEKTEELKKIRSKCKEVVRDADKLLDKEERRVLKGKLEKYKREYKTAYFHAHQKIVGDEVDWNKVSSITDSQKLKQLRSLKDVKCTNSEELELIERKISNFKSIKCQKLSEKTLEEKVKCPHCSFPENIEERDMDEEIEEVENLIDETYLNWKETILSEVEDNSDKLERLENEQRSRIEDILDQEDIPDDIDRELVESLNTLLSDIEEVKISSSDIEDFVFEEGKVMTYERFESKLEELSENIASNHDRDKLRIKWTRSNK